MNNVFNFFMEKSIDNCVCKLLDIPQNVYEQMPGKDGRKLFTEKEYNYLLENEYSWAKLKNCVKTTDGGKRKTMVFDNGILKTISACNSMHERKGIKNFNLMVGTIGEGSVLSESYYFEQEKDGSYKIQEYEATKVDTKENDEMLGYTVRKYTSDNHYGDHHHTDKKVIMALTHLGQVENRQNFKCIACPSQTVHSIISDNQTYESRMQVAHILDNAKTFGNSMFKELSETIAEARANNKFKEYVASLD